VPELAKELFAAHGAEYARLQRQLRAIESRLMAWHRGHEPSRRLAEVPAIGPISASRLTIRVTEPLLDTVASNRCNDPGGIRRVANPLERARPMMRRCAGHYANQAGRQLLKERKNATTLH